MTLLTWRNTTALLFWMNGVCHTSTKPYNQWMSVVLQVKKMSVSVHVCVKCILHVLRIMYNCPYCVFQYDMIWHSMVVGRRWEIHLSRNSVQVEQWLAQHLWRWPVRNEGCRYDNCVRTWPNSDTCALKQLSFIPLPDIFIRCFVWISFAFRLSPSTVFVMVAAHELKSLVRFFGCHKHLHVPLMTIIGIHVFWFRFDSIRFDSIWFDSINTFVSFRSFRNAFGCDVNFANIKGYHRYSCTCTSGTFSLKCWWRWLFFDQHRAHLLLTSLVLLFVCSIC